MKGLPKPVLYLLCFLLIFAIFIYILLRPSTQSKAMKEIETCLTTQDIKMIWYKYRSDLFDDEDFRQAVRDKLKSFNLNQTDISEIKTWLPSKTKNLNIILVPDLSKRIKDDKNNPGQIQNDTALLNTAWRVFEKNVRLKMNSKDRLIVDIADPGQGQGQFGKVADSLVFNLADFKNKSNRLFFKAVQGKFESNIKNLYDLAKEKTSGADYVYFFSEKLASLLRKSTLDDDFRNIVILITDGYLEITQKDGSSKSISPSSNTLQQHCVDRTTTSFRYPSTPDLMFPDVEVYLLEANERQEGLGCHFKGLKKWWSTWLTEMGVKNSTQEFMFKRLDAINLSKKNIEEIFTRK